uniref:Protein RFT1 homolog n=1 Tax=Zooxanthella nutricula TaxID=1333877 RepID=A0A7S2JGM6_9DINO
MQKGVSLVTTFLVRVFFAGRLEEVLQAPNRDNAWKLREVEFYASTAAFFKPFMDLVQRRARDLSVFLAIPGIPLLLRVLSTADPKDFGLEVEDESQVAWALSLLSFVLALGSAASDLGGWALSWAAFVLQLGSSAFALGLQAFGVVAEPGDMTVSMAWALWLGEWILGLGSYALSFGSWVASWAHAPGPSS